MPNSSSDPTTWLLLDCPFLCRRAQHSIGSLAFSGEPTGVIYGFLRAVIDVQRRYGTDKVIFCWDQGRSLRAKIYPEYKASRQKKEWTKEEWAVEDQYRRQVNDLKFSLLEDLGFRNTFAEDGYEADDLIASLCDSLLIDHPEDSQVIVSADKDLYQLLDANTILWNPASKREVEIFDLLNEYDIRPDLWAKVKAISGCSSDGVKGVKGIGEKRACGYLNGSLKESSRYYQTIEENWGTVIANLDLVTLPFPGTPTFKLQEDDVRPSKWRAVAEKLGMGSLRNLFR